MQRVDTVDQVFTAIQRVKSNAPAFCTNFFPWERKLRGWIDHAELFGEFRDEVAFFMRKDRDFWHLYFCAAGGETLKRGIALLTDLKKEPVVVDLIGNESASNELAVLIESGEFRPYRRFHRMARTGLAHVQPSGANGSPVVYADRADAPTILNLLCHSFDRYAEQLPMLYEIETAIDNRQVLVAKHEGTLAGLLFFETQGFTSMLRYWLVSERFRAFRFGSALMYGYFTTQKTVRRFVLWVLTGNENAIQKYQHYGYVADGLVNLVLANQIIRA